MKKVLVTGISGFVGQHCAAELLKKGYAVRGSVRSLSKTDEVVNGIKKEIDPKDNLEFCELDLMNDAGWDKAMEGCDYVLHVASPFVVKVPKDENEIIKPAVDGTLRALKAAKKAGVNRVVLTSSTVAMHGGQTGLIKINQDSWTNLNAKDVTAYFKSKTLAEKSAWEFIKNQTGVNKLELVVVNPGPIYGPTLTGNLATEAMDFFKKLITGKVPMLPKAYSVMSDVRDVATIHVAALENEKANGKRFIVTTEKPQAIQQIGEILKSNGYDKVSTKLAPTFLLKFIANFNAEMKGMLPFVGNTIEADVSDTMKT
ncbi:MAG: aldehyde reductase, partial [Actinobacteria bacterium]|nr:aldehyde reductase [Actinomycetota bacterium]